MAERSDEGLYVVIGGDVAPLRAALSDASRMSNKFANDLTRAFTDAAVKGRSLSDVLKQLAVSLSKHTVEAALAPISRAFGNMLTQLIGGGVAPSLPLPFAHGGVIASPVTFPLGGNRMGLAGEAGPEAILPLARGRDGRLGVRAEGGGSGVNITFNVAAQDATSFRHSEGQIAAMLSRAVGRGQRNL